MRAVIEWKCADTGGSSTSAQFASETSAIDMTVIDMTKKLLPQKPRGRIKANARPPAGGKDEKLIGPLALMLNNIKVAAEAIGPFPAFIAIVAIFAGFAIYAKGSHVDTSILALAGMALTAGLIDRRNRRE